MHHANKLQAFIMQSLLTFQFRMNDESIFISAATFLPFFPFSFQICTRGLFICSCLYGDLHVLFPGFYFNNWHLGTFFFFMDVCGDFTRGTLPRTDRTKLHYGLVSDDLMQANFALSKKKGKLPSLEYMHTTLFNAYEQITRTVWHLNTIINICQMMQIFHLPLSLRWMTIHVT